MYHGSVSLEEDFWIKETEEKFKHVFYIHMSVYYYLVCSIQISLYIINKVSIWVQQPNL